MTQIEMNYAIVLYELGIENKVIEKARHIFSLTPELLKNLESPVVDLKAKHRIVDRIFPIQIRNFLKILCDYQSIGAIDEILNEYLEYSNKENGILSAFLYYYEEPTKEQMEGFNRYLAKQYKAKKVQLHIANRPELLGGFVLRVNDYEIDWSMKERLNELKQKLVRR